jgi:hypothetical protein
MLVKEGEFLRTVLPLDIVDKSSSLCKSCIGYLGHPFEKESPLASITLPFFLVRWVSANDRGGE